MSVFDLSCWPNVCNQFQKGVTGGSFPITLTASGQPNLTGIIHLQGVNNGD